MSVLGVCDSYNSVTSICKHVIIFYFAYLKIRDYLVFVFLVATCIEEKEVINVLLKSVSIVNFIGEITLLRSLKHKYHYSVK